MKSKRHNARLTVAATLFGLLLGANTNAQDWHTNGNAGISSGTDYLGTKDVNDMVIRTNAIERGRLFGVGGAWRFGTAANYATIDSTGKLSFFGKAFYQVDKNKYVFSASNDPDIGLFYNSSLKQFEYRDKNALPVFFVNYETGSGQFNGSLKVGAYTLPAIDGAANQVLKTNGAGVLAWSNDEDNNTIYNAGTGLSLSGNTFSNSAPDQTVSLAGGTGISITGTYPNFTATNTAPDQTVTLTGTDGISITGTYPNFSASGATLWGTSGNTGTAASTNFIGTTDNAGLSIRTNSTERIRVLADGGVGIGTSVPNSRLQVNSAAGEDALRVQVNGSTRFLVNDLGGTSIGTTTEAPAASLIVSGNVGIGNFTPSNKLDVAGNIGVTSNILSSGSGMGIQFINGQYLKDNSANSSIELLVHANLLPDTDNSHSLGNSTHRWSEIWLASAMVAASDARDNKNIRDLNYGLKQIMQLRSVKFNSTNNEESGDKIGVIAQELQKVMPELVRDYEVKIDEATGKKERVPAERLGVIYSDMIPVLIKAIQELEQQVQELKNEKAATNTARTSPAPAEEKTNTVLASLEQNAPNPFNSNTSIRYFLPSNAQGQLLINDNAGNTVKKYNLTAKGHGVIQINAGELTAGSYYYTLIVDGKKADSKKMVLIK